MKRPRKDASEPELETELREAFVADDPEAAWYFDRAEERVVRVAHGETDIPELPAEEVEEDDERYVEIPAVTDSELHDWIEEFVDEQSDPAIAALLDERQDANARFLQRLAATNAAAFVQWKAFHERHVDEAIAGWRESLGD